MSKQPLGLATPAAQPRGDDHPFLTKAPAADPTKSPSNRSRLGI